ncbi:MAG TPA: Gfo/Idh/MocA family oxidoreductase [Candidatus Dormibacteraeota bacterium]|nr:Gfo/Idh/MocA family oxidoreductase [Candidatus Dormibacteraeota bacterium]
MAIDTVAPDDASPVLPLPESPATAPPPRVELVLEPQPAAPIRIGVIGYGYWGPNVVRNFAEVPGSRVVAVSDMRQERLDQVAARYPAVRTATDGRALIQDPSIDAVVIMTPVSTHYELALAALQANKHVLVAKPIATSSSQAARLVAEAARRKRVLMVDHTFIYTGAVRRIKELVDSGSLGRLYYYDSVRVNLGLFQHDVNVLWDLAVHDLSIMDYVLGQQPRAVAATGAAHIPGQPVNMAYLTCFFDNNLIAHHHVNWMAPVKVRRTLVSGSRQMIVYDDLEPSEKIKLYDKGITLTSGPERVYEALIGYRTGDMWAPQISLTEGLRVEAQHFLDCIQRGCPPLSDGDAGLRVVRILEAATHSLTLSGQPVELANEPITALAADPASVAPNVVAQAAVAQGSG